MEINIWKTKNEKICYQVMDNKKNIIKERYSLEENTFINSIKKIINEHKNERIRFLIDYMGYNEIKSLLKKHNIL